MRNRIPRKKTTASTKSKAHTTPEDPPQASQGTTGKITSKFTPEELRRFDEVFSQAQVEVVKQLKPPVPATGKTGMFPTRPTSARNQHADPRAHAAWIDWETAPPGRKPLYRSLALRYFGRADCVVCGKHKAVLFGLFNIKRAQWWLRQNLRTGDCYCCKHCKTPYLLSDRQTGRLCCDLPKDFPASVPDTFLKLSKWDSNNKTLSLKKSIPRLHKLLQ